MDKGYKVKGFGKRAYGATIEFGALKNSQFSRFTGIKTGEQFYKSQIFSPIALFRELGMNEDWPRVTRVSPRAICFPYPGEYSVQLFVEFENNFATLVSYTVKA